MFWWHLLMEQGALFSKTMFSKKHQLYVTGQTRLPRLFCKLILWQHAMTCLILFIFTLIEDEALWFNPKRAGLFGPISQPGGGAGFRPPKISETDWRNIKCVVLVDSYDPPESTGTKKVQTYLVWRHSDVISDVISKTRKSPKIAKIMVFRYFSKQSCIYWQWCVSKYAYTCSYPK